MKIITICEIPDDIVQSWLEYVQAFNLRYEGKCKISAMAHDPKMTVQELRDIVEMRPNTTIFHVGRKPLP